ncbi:hypothetical protein HYT23_06705 [Candidatus Pacearchaeota archaeon]|nr:hypothetical protein [Candidatus Pacearchaeota archaeon]
MKRKKRLARGIESLKKQVEIHKGKLGKVIEEGNEELARYYIKDIFRLEIEERKKEEKLKK